MSKSYLRALESEFGEGSNAIRLELNKFEAANLLRSESEGNRKFFFANQEHPLFDNINGLVKKHLGIDSVVEQIAGKIGNLHTVYLTGTMAKGVNDKMIDLILVGDQLDRVYLNKLVEKVEGMISKKVRYAIYSLEEFMLTFKEGEKENMLIIWNYS